MTAPIGAYHVAAQMIMGSRPSPTAPLQPAPTWMVITDLCITNLVLWSVIAVNIWWYS